MRGSPAAAISGIVLIGALFSPFASVKPALYAAVVSAAGVFLFLMCLERELRAELARPALGIVVLMPLLAWTLPNIALLYVAMLLWVPLWAGRFEQIAPIYFFSLLFLPGLDSDLMVGSLKLFGLGVHDALAVGAAAAIFRSGEKARPAGVSDAVVLSAVLMIAVALSRQDSISHLVRTLLNVSLDLALPYYIASRGLRAIENIVVALRWLACAGLGLATCLIFEAWRSWPIYNELYTRFELPTLLLVKARGGLMRAGGPFVESTSAAMVMAICVLALLVLRASFRSKTHFGLVFAVALIGLSAPQSRGAWVGLALGIAAADLFRRNYSGLLMKTVPLMAAGLLVATTATLSPNLSETLGLTGTSSETAEYRRALLRRGMEEFWHAPVLGHSPAELKWRLADLSQGEGIIDFVNTYLWIGLIGGLVGLIIFAGSFVYCARQVWTIRERAFATVSGQAGATFVFASIVMILEMLFFTSFGGRPAFLSFALCGMAVALSNAVGTQPQDRQANEPPVPQPLWLS